ncbi:hypothetical protein SELMODRAFT_87170 [Selaginella moellendorffii]|uniref:F-box domain-containing protein n=1 Tax=Selaginella moellendorffii TaxID=88036 RepID=D8R792_SELML|nr:hypothetical protein SELMODRAFT_87170 [Selaginella moellendorffii]
MDPNLWSHLPDDLLDRILAWLPIDAFFRLATLCRRWSRLATSKSFHDLCATVPSTAILFVKIIACDCQQLLTTFSPAASRWYKLPLAFLPPNAGLPVATARGLLCFTNHFQGYNNDEYTALFVCNPLTKAWRELPPMLFHHRPTLVTMVADAATKSYKLVVAGRWTTEVYSSATNSWKRSACLPRGEEISRNVALCNGVLYCLTPRWYNCSLLAFSIQHETWIKIKTGRLPGYCQFRNLVECSGQVAIVGKCVRHQVFTICVWFLDQRSLKWREVGRMPKVMAEYFLVMPSESFYCSGIRNLVFLTRDTSHDGVLFDISTKSWRWVPDCPNLEGMAFEPRLDAVP